MRSAVRAVVEWASAQAQGAARFPGCFSYFGSPVSLDFFWLPSSLVLPGLGGLLQLIRAHSLSLALVDQTYLPYPTPYLTILHSTFSHLFSPSTNNSS